MNQLDTQTIGILVAVIVMAMVALAAWVHHRRSQSHRLEERFGTEYHHMLEQVGDRAKAEAELRQRERRVEKLNIAPLAPAAAQRFHQQWQELQGRFVDSPDGTLADADRLVRELMQQRGYPLGDFESRAADISVDHPQVVSNFRAAHDIALRSRDGGSTTEDLRKAVIHYRALFAELLEVAEERPRDLRH
jgi:hypothetical protein